MPTIRDLLDRLAPLYAEDSETVEAVKPQPKPVRLVAAAPFLASFTSEHIARMELSDYLSFDLETTALTPTSRPIAVGKSAKIGPSLTWQAYQAATGASLDCRPRARICTVALSDDSVLAWDLDKLGVEETRSLFCYVLTAKKPLIGHNIGFDLTWMYSVAGVWEPKHVFDSMLAVKTLAPWMSFDVHIRAAEGCPSSIAVVTQPGSKVGSFSLSALSAGAGFGVLDKSYQHPRNWCPDVLSMGHYTYVMGDVHAPVKLLRRIVDAPEGARWPDVQSELVRHDHERAGGMYMRVYSRAPAALAAIATRGIPVHEQTLEAVEEHHSAAVPGLVERVLSLIPGLQSHEARLLSTQPGVPAEIKVVLGAYAAENGFDLGVGSDGHPVISSKNALLKGAASLEGWRAWDALQTTKNVLGSCSEVRGVSRAATAPGFRTLHPLVGATAVTGRVRSEVPNVQNFPRPAAGLEDGLQIRSIVRAPEGWSIVSADYGQIELRIAAALASRAMDRASDAVAGRFQTPNWVRDALCRGSDDTVQLTPEDTGFAGVRDRLAQAWRTVRHKGAPMAEAFRAGVDPHLLTGLHMAAKQGVVDLGSKTAMEYLINAPKDERDALKKRIAAQRQAAKALNFGLLYGMQASGLHSAGVVKYGLKWSVAEAERAREDWFELYPEVAFWHSWVRHVAIRPKVEAYPMLLRNDYSGVLERRDVRLGYSSTLAGRPVCSELMREIANYSDQGTGADMMLEAVLGLPQPTKSRVMNTIHDEVFLLVPDSEVEQAAVHLKESMLRAADRVLGPFGIPAECDPQVSKYWTKD